MIQIAVLNEWTGISDADIRTMLQPSDTNGTLTSSQSGELDRVAVSRFLRCLVFIERGCFEGRGVRTLITRQKGSLSIAPTNQTSWEMWHPGRPE
jgi:hypothetical protein